MEIPVPIRRLVYRVGYRTLQAIWLITRPTLRGVKCVVTDRNQVLLVRHSYGRRWWDLPGGATRRGEPPPRAARREMHEELGLEDVEWKEIGHIEVTSGRRTDHLHCFRAELHEPAIRLDPGELLEARWFARDQLPDDRSPHLVAILGLTLARSAGPAGRTS
jgi:8-oxo-dGTP pyrophosphatase MutT (NUDIX family)